MPARQAITINAAYLATAVFVFIVWVWGADTVSTSLNGDPRSPLGGLIYGTAYQPFVHRALVPIVTRSLVGVIPPSWKQGVSNFLMGSAKFRKEAARLGWELQYIPEYLICLSLAFASLAAFPFVVRSLFVSLYDASSAVTNLVPLGMLLGLPPFFLVGTHYIFDFPALLFFTTCFLFLVRRQWFFFYPVYAIGCVNKETMVLLAAAMILIYGRTLPLKELSLHVLAQLLIFGSVKAALIFTFQANPGVSAEFHLFGNIHNLLLPYTFEDAFFLILLCFLVFYDFRTKHPILTRAAWLLLPFGLLMFAFGWMSEIRVLYEIYPVFAILIAHTIAFSFLKKAYVVRI